MHTWSQSTRSAPVQRFSEKKKPPTRRLLHPPRCCSSICSDNAPQGAYSYIYAIDHLSTKLCIPLSATEPTQALNDDGLVPGLCRLYLEGRCRQGEYCYQVHADQKVVNFLREEALKTPSCCYIHGARCNLESFPLGLTFTLVNSMRDIPKHHNSSIYKGNDKGQSENMNKSEADSSEEKQSTCRGVGQKPVQKPPNNTVISIHSFCPTSFLWALYSQNASSHIYIPKNKVCRDHRKGLCRFGDECNFVHMCRNIPLDCPNSFDDATFLHSSDHFSMVPYSSKLSRGPCSLQPNDLESNDKWSQSRQNEIVDSLNQYNSLEGVPRCFDEWSASPQFTSEHACTYSGMPASQILNKRSEPLLRPSGQKVPSPANNYRCTVSHNPYSSFIHGKEST